MADIEVMVKGSLVGETERVRPFVAKDVEHSRISLRLAEKLGLTEFRDVYITSTAGCDCQRWKISTFPVKVWHKRYTMSIYPIVCCTEGDAFYELVLSFDALQQLPMNELNMIADTEEYDYSWPTPGPRYDPSLHFGKTVWFTPIEEMPRINQFLEYSCHRSKGIKRLAINKVTRQLVVIFSGGDYVYCYAGLHKQFEFEIEDGRSKGKILSAVKRVCNCKIIDCFPDAVLAEPHLSLGL